MPPISRLFKGTFRSGGGGQAVEFGHQPRLATRSVVRVNDALAGNAVKRADSHSDCTSGHGRIAGADCRLSLFHKCASGSPVRPISQSLLLGDADALLGSLVIRQGGSPLESFITMKQMPMDGKNAATSQVYQSCLLTSTRFRGLNWIGSVL